MGMMDAVKSVFSNYANFEGRARRSEYWLWTLFNILLTVAFGLLIIPFSNPYKFDPSPLIGLLTILMILYSVGIIIPGLAVTIRRLHDSGKSGWWYLISLIPFGGIVLLIFLILETEPGTNKYGPDPRIDASEHYSKTETPDTQRAV